MRVIFDLLRHNFEFAAGVFLIGIVLVVSAMSFFSPYDPELIYVVIPDMPPSAEYIMGTTSRGQDTFWQLTFAIRNTLLFGLSVALMSRILSLTIGLVSGYLGGTVDRVLMSINDTFVVIPLFPILVLFYFVMRDSMSWAALAVVMGLARLGLRCPPDPLRHDEPAKPRVHPAERVLRHDHAPDRDAGAPALRAADRLLDDHEQHELVDRAGSDPVRARLHQHQHAGPSG